MSDLEALRSDVLKEKLAKFDKRDRSGRWRRFGTFVVGSGVVAGDMPSDGRASTWAVAGLFAAGAALTSQTSYALEKFYTKTEIRTQEHIEKYEVYIPKFAMRYSLGVTGQMMRQDISRLSQEKERDIEYLSKLRLFSTYFNDPVFGHKTYSFAYALSRTMRNTYPYHLDTEGASVGQTPPNPLATILEQYFPLDPPKDQDPKLFAAEAGVSWHSYLHRYVSDPDIKNGVRALWYESPVQH